MITTDSITETGETALWVAFAAMTFSSVVFVFLAYTRSCKAETRLFYYITTLITAIAALAYLVMAMGETEMFIWRDNKFRGFHWVRYVDWALTVPLLLVDLGLLAGAHWTENVFNVLCSLLMIAAGYAGAVHPGYNATWPLFAFGFVAFAPVACSLLTTYRRNAYRFHSEVGRLFDYVGFGSVFLWTGYGVVWGCSEGGLKMTADQEVIVYAALDITAKCVFGFVLLFGREAIARYGTLYQVITAREEVVDVSIQRSTYTTTTAPTPVRIAATPAASAAAPAPAATVTVTSKGTVTVTAAK